MLQEKIFPQKVNGETRRNIIFVGRVLGALLALIVSYSLIFHLIMVYEGREYSFITGFYWALTVMTTLGFGDITFHSDFGMVFTMIVLLSGVLFFMLFLPVTFLRFVFLPMLEAQKRSAIVRKLPPKTEGHIVLVGSDENAQSIARHLAEHKLAPYLLVEDTPTVLKLEELGFAVMQGDVDTPSTYINAQTAQAAMVVALHDDMKNTNIVSTIRGVAPKVPLVTRALAQESVDILRLAGASQVFYFAFLLGTYLARRIFKKSVAANIVGKFEGFCVAEAQAHNMPFVGKTLAEANLRQQFGLNVIGIWQENDYAIAMPDTVISDTAILLLVGNEEDILNYNVFSEDIESNEDRMVLILGGGTVGNVVAEKMRKRNMPYRVVEKNPELIPPGDPNYICGNAADIKVLKAAGIDKASSIVVTTHNDDVNVYLTIYCRKLRPDAQIISRSNQDRNVANLYGVGANLVVSQSRMIAVTIVNQMLPGRVVMLTHGLNIFEIPVPRSLVGKTLQNSNIRSKSLCNVVATKSSGGLAQAPPDPSLALKSGDMLVLIGSDHGEKTFREQFGG